MDQIQTDTAILSDPDSTDSRLKLDQIDEVSCVLKAYPLQFRNKPKRIRSRVHGALTWCINAGAAKLWHVGPSHPTLVAFSSIEYY